MMDYQESPSVSHECEVCGDAYVSNWPVTVLCTACRASMLGEEDYDADEYEDMPPEGL
jgi:hypothetical protein